MSTVHQVIQEPHRKKKCLHGVQIKVAQETRLQAFLISWLQVCKQSILFTSVLFGIIPVEFLHASVTQRIVSALLTTSLYQECVFSWTLTVNPVFCIVTIFGRTVFLFFQFAFPSLSTDNMTMHVALLKPTSTCNQLSLFSWLLAAKGLSLGFKLVVMTTLPWHTNDRVSRLLCSIIPWKSRSSWL